MYVYLCAHSFLWYCSFWNDFTTLFVTIFTPQASLIQKEKKVRCLDFNFQNLRLKGFPALILQLKSTLTANSIFPITFWTIEFSKNIFLNFQVCFWLCFFQECYFRCNMKSGKIFVVLSFILSQFYESCERVFAKSLFLNFSS